MASLFRKKEKKEIVVDSIVPLLELKVAVPAMPSAPIKFAIIGAGQRGRNYGYYYSVGYSKWAEVVAVAEPIKYRREIMQKSYQIPDENTFTDWKELAKRPKLCDAVVISTLDHLHAEPAIAFANLGYHILLEKPMAASIEDCYEITKAVIRNKVTFAIGHVLRYTAHNKLIKRIIETGLLGDVVNIQHMEPVGFWHFAHSYVRGNWGNEKDSCFSLMTKCCHDIDLLMHWIGSPCVKISSFGNLRHFRKSNKPKDAGDATRCTDCALSSSCPYSATKVYLDPAKRGHTRWPLSVLTDDVDVENITEALKNGPYGRCVYECDNDVVDNQIVNMEFANGATASCTMIAFTESICARKTRVFGTMGELECDGTDEIRYFDFKTQEHETLMPSRLYGVLDLSGHGGGDFGLAGSFLHAIAAGDDEKYVKSGVQETFESHLYVFAAEHSRKTGKVVEIDEFKRELGIKEFMTKDEIISSTN